MKRIALFLLIALVAVSSADAQKVKRKLQKEKRNFNWYLLKQGDSRGAERTDGTIIIPLDLRYSNIKYYWYSYLFVVTDINGLCAVYDTNGNVLVPIECGYNWILPDYIYMLNETEHLVYHVSRGIMRGIRDKNGKEVFAPEHAYTIEWSYVKNGKRTIYYWQDIEDKLYTGIAYYTGMCLDPNGEIVPDPDHPLGSTNKPIPEDNQEETAYNIPYQPINNYNTYTPPAQHKQQSTENKSNSTAQPKSSPKSSAGTSSNNPSTTRTTKERTHPFENYNKPVKCANCRGTGMANCWSCGGKGTIRKSGIDKNGKQVFRNERCTGCGGSGKRKCTVCNGKGTR